MTPLTARESEVLHYLILGKAPKEIAQDLNISVNTVRNHVKSVYRKAGAHSRAALMVLARDGQILATSGEFLVPTKPVFVVSSQSPFRIEAFLSIEQMAEALRGAGWTVTCPPTAEPQAMQHINVGFRKEAV